MQLLAGPKQVSADVVPKSRHQPVTSSHSGASFGRTKTKNEDRPGNEDIRVSSNRIDVLGFICSLSAIFLQRAQNSNDFPVFLLISFGFKKQNWTLDDKSGAIMSHVCDMSQGIFEAKAKLFERNGLGFEDKTRSKGFQQLDKMTRRKGNSIV